MTATDIELLDDATWNAEREAVEVTAIVKAPGPQRRVLCVVAQEALDELVRAPAPLNPVRLVSDFETRIAAAAARRVDLRSPEVVLSRRDFRGAL